MNEFDGSLIEAIKILSQRLIRPLVDVKKDCGWYLHVHIRLEHVY